MSRRLLLDTSKAHYVLECIVYQVTLFQLLPCFLARVYSTFESKRSAQCSSDRNIANYNAETGRPRAHHR